ncbi:hypothetical protein yrohd0001_2850 [Yersinia rohdei ATCC 43380]|nr:hypothetical protein yrohd0001_2850 [Yersinia rohdei ATCC 43380]
MEDAIGLMTKDFRGCNKPPLRWRDSLRISLSLASRAHHSTIPPPKLIN